MPKTHYLGFTKAGKPVGRASGHDYGYTHAGVVPAYKRLPNFSTSRQGVEKLLSAAIKSGQPYEIVEVKVVSAAEYRAAMKGGA